MTAAQQPEWWIDYEVERAATRALTQMAHADAAYRSELTAEAKPEIDDFAETLRSAFIDTSELSSADLHALAATAQDIATLFRTLGDALLYAEGGLQ
jgi:hypothetical protein